MPLYEIAAIDDLKPFRRLAGGSDLYEREIEDLFWANGMSSSASPCSWSLASLRSRRVAAPTS
jgi:hypothetical protein